MNLLKQFIDNHLREIGSKAGLSLYFRNTVWLFIEKISKITIGLCIGIWVARYLGPEKFGVLNYSLSFVLLFSALSTLGLDNVIVKALTESIHSERLLMGTAFLLKVFGGICAFTLIALVSFQMDNAPQTHHIILIIAISLLFQPVNIVEFFFRSQVKGHFFAFSSLVSLIVGAILRAYLILSNRGLQTFAAVIALEYLITGIVLILFYSRAKRSIFKWRFNGRTAIHLLRQSWPLLFSSLMISIYMRIDQVMIQRILGDQSVGYYSSAVRISEAWYFVPLVLCQSLLPSIVKTRSADPIQYHIRIQKLFELINLVSIAITIPLFFLSNMLIPLLYGSDYSPAGTVLQYHVWAGIFVGMGLASSNWLLVENLQRYQMFNLACGAIMNVVLNYFLIKKLNIQGAAIATLMAYFYSSYVALLIFPQTRPCFFKLTRALVPVRFFSNILNTK